MSFVKRGDDQPIVVIDPVDVNDEETRSKIESMKETANFSELENKKEESN